MNHGSNVASDRSESLLGRMVDLGFAGLKLVVGLLLMVMVVLVLGNVALRYGFNSSITISEELSRWAFVWMTFLGALIALRERAHIGVDVVISRLGPSGRRVCQVLGHLLMLYVCWLLLEGSWAQTEINWEVAAPSSGLSMRYFYGAGVLFSVLALPLLLYDLFRGLKETPAGVAGSGDRGGEDEPIPSREAGKGSKVRGRGRDDEPEAGTSGHADGHDHGGDKERTGTDKAGGGDTA
ncbi:MAG: TRAP transporter small permease [Lautropia sp.]|nr:TRAP transporter small permease [Lautropia sp.]